MLMHDASTRPEGAFDSPLLGNSQNAAGAALAHLRILQASEENKNAAVEVEYLVLDELNPLFKARNDRFAAAG